MRVYHQAGHNAVWNLESHLAERNTHGLIVSPRDQSANRVKDLPGDVRGHSMFDPQFYSPRHRRNRLATYDFFPDRAAKSFETATYSKFASQVAEKCVRFQHERDFERVVIPTRCLPATPSDFIEIQQEHFITPFLTACANQAIKKPLMLQLVVNVSMLQDNAFRHELLNWATGIDEISGVYLIFDVPRTRKQIDQADLILHMLRFVDSLSVNNLEVVIGYLNTESVVLSLADPAGVAVGTYETTRAFSIRNFQEREDKFAPNMRLYVSRLLQWVDHDYLRPICEVLGDVLDHNKYLDATLDPLYKPHVNKPEPYRHHLLVFPTQLQRIGSVDGPDRFALVVDMLEQARRDYEALGGVVVLDPRSDGSHIAPWLTAAKLFGRQKGWA